MQMFFSHSLFTLTFLQYAHKLAYQVGQNLHKLPRKEMSDKLHFLWSIILISGISSLPHMNKSWKAEGACLRKYPSLCVFQCIHFVKGWSWFVTKFSLSGSSKDGWFCSCCVTTFPSLPQFSIHLLYLSKSIKTKLLVRHKIGLFSVSFILSFATPSELQHFVCVLLKLTIWIWDLSVVFVFLDLKKSWKSVSDNSYWFYSCKNVYHFHMAIRLRKQTFGHILT